MPDTPPTVVCWLHNVPSPQHHHHLFTNALPESSPSMKRVSCTCLPFLPRHSFYTYFFSLFLLCICLSMPFGFVPYHAIAIVNVVPRHRHHRASLSGGSECISIADDDFCLARRSLGPTLTLTPVQAIVPICVGWWSCVMVVVLGAMLDWPLPMILGLCWFDGVLTLIKIKSIKTK